MSKSSMPKDERSCRAYAASFSEPLQKLDILNALGAHPWSGRLQVLESVDSTNTFLRRLANEGAPEGTVVIADRQTAGRGRMGRSFFSAPGVGVYLSVLLRPNLPPDALMTLTAQAAVAVSDAIHDICGVMPDIKWVNDLLLDGRKICGILTELGFDAAHGTVSTAIIGVGVNCNQLPTDFPEELRPIAGSIRMATGDVTPRDRLTAALIRKLSELPKLDWYDAYRRSCITIGKQICFSDRSGAHLAEALDIGRNAELRVRMGDGTVYCLNSGEATLHQTQ